PSRPWLRPAENPLSRPPVTTFGKSDLAANIDKPAPAEAGFDLASHSKTIAETKVEPVPAPPTSDPLRLDLFQALETALLQNPDLTTLRRNEGVSAAALGVAQTYPFNPFLQMQVTPLQEAKNAGSGTVYLYVLLMQTIQLGHQQRSREETA